MMVVDMIRGTKKTLLFIRKRT